MEHPDHLESYLRDLYSTIHFLLFPSRFRVHLVIIYSHFLFSIALFFVYLITEKCFLLANR